MAVRDWTGTDGGNEGDFATAANWSGAVVPITADTWRALAGQQSFTAGLDQSAKNFAEVNIGKDYAGDVASAAAYLQCGITRLIYQGARAAFFDCSTGSFNFDDVVLDSPQREHRLNLKGTVLDVQAERGALTLQTGTTTKLHMEKKTQLTSEPDVLVVAATVTTAYVGDGVLTMEGDASGALTTLYVFNNGRVVVEDGGGTNVYQFGGEIIWNSSSVPGNVFVYGGRFDASQDIRAKVFGATTFEMHAGSYVNLANPGRNITMDGGGTGLVYYGGELIWPNGTIVRP
jgi:hypothetical protein